MKKGLMYVRKSRPDREFTEDENEQTLKRHKELLFKLAADKKIHVEHVFEEIVSGDSIAARPEMQKLLNFVETGDYFCVLVVDLQRLGRGNSIDQGIIQNTFKFSDTKIITPNKTYDFTNEFDEEYSEFELFMGRKEYSMTKRRLLNGRLASVREGKWPGGNAPYGYKTYKLKGQKGYSLAKIEDQSAVVNMIYDWYVYGVPQADGTRKVAGAYIIAKTLNEVGYRNQYGKQWIEGHITKIIGNVVYIGKVAWYNRKQIKKMVDGEIITSSTKMTEDVKIVCDGLHEPIISEEIFYKAVQIKEKRRPHIPRGRKMRNPFAGVLYCKKCGGSMWLRSKDKTDYSLYCHNVNCDNRGLYLSIFEKKFLAALKYWMDGYQVESAHEAESDADIRHQISNLDKHYAQVKTTLSALNKQLTKAYDLVETGIYDTQTFIERSENIKKSISDTEHTLDTIIKKKSDLEIYLEKKVEIIPRMQKLVDTYPDLSVDKKNEIVTSLVERIDYEKHRWGRGHQDDFEITVYPKVPKL